MRSQKDGLLALLSACDTIEADRRLHDCGVKRSRVTELEDAQRLHLAHWSNGCELTGGAAADGGGDDDCHLLLPPRTTAAFFQKPQPPLAALSEVPTPPLFREGGSLASAATAAHAPHVAGSAAAALGSAQQLPGLPGLPAIITSRRTSVDMRQHQRFRRCTHEAGVGSSSAKAGESAATSGGCLLAPATPPYSPSGGATAAATAAAAADAPAPGACSCTQPCSGRGGCCSAAAVLASPARGPDAMELTNSACSPGGAGAELPSPARRCFRRSTGGAPPGEEAAALMPPPPSPPQRQVQASSYPAVAVLPPPVSVDALLWGWGGCVAV
eukprot:XP_001703251.1 predicted protein [Chlamydomonas reinhardtii]